jgi:hypothetical protein
LNPNLRNKDTFLGHLKSHKVDILFAFFIISFSAYFYLYVSISAIPTSDGAEDLNNARSWLTDTPVTGAYGAPLISWIIVGTWLVTGENWLIIISDLCLYHCRRNYFVPSVKEAQRQFICFWHFSTNDDKPHLFFWGRYIMTESLSLFFIILALYFIKSEKESHWYLAGIALGLTFASCY